MEETMLDICNALYNNIQQTKKYIYWAVVGCGRRECSECEYCTLCNKIFDLEVELFSIINPEENIESED